MTDPPPLPAFGRPSLMADLRWWADYLGAPERASLTPPVTESLQHILRLAAETLTQAEAQIAALRQQLGKYVEQHDADAPQFRDCDCPLCRETRALLTPASKETP
jgi:hypothetical protein